MMVNFAIFRVFSWDLDGETPTKGMMFFWRNWKVNSHDSTKKILTFLETNIYFNQWWQNPNVSSVFTMFDDVWWWIHDLSWRFNPQKSIICDHFAGITHFLHHFSRWNAHVPSCLVVKSTYFPPFVQVSSSIFHHAPGEIARGTGRWPQGRHPPPRRPRRPRPCSAGVGAARGAAQGGCGQSIWTT